MSSNSPRDDNEFEIYINDTKKISSQEWEKAMSVKLNMNSFPLEDYDPGKNTLEKAENKFGLFVDDNKGDSIVSVSEVVNPYKGISFGFIECFARVSSTSSSISGTLVLRIDQNKLGKVERESLRLFKWNEDLKFFQLVELSAVGREDDYVWGRITSPGIYAVIGLNSEPSKSRLLKTISNNMEQLKTLKAEKQKAFLHELAKSILGPDDPFTKSFEDKGSLDS